MVKMQWSEYGADVGTWQSFILKLLAWYLCCSFDAFVCFFLLLLFFLFLDSFLPFKWHTVRKKSCFSWVFEMAAVVLPHYLFCCLPWFTQVATWQTNHVNMNVFKPSFYDENSGKSPFPILVERLPKKFFALLLFSCSTFAFRFSMGCQKKEETKKLFPC